MLKNNKIYMAGPLFKESDQKQKIYEGKVLKELGFDTFNPIENLFVGSGQEFSAQIVFDLDNNAIQESGFFYFDLDTNDTGTLTEFGQAVQLVHDGKVDPKNVVVVTCDKGRHEVYGTEYFLTHIFNAYTGGAILNLGIKIVNDFEEARVYLDGRLKELELV